MKTLKKIGRFIAAATLIASGLCACATAAPPVELDAAKLASLQNASWVVYPQVRFPITLFPSNTMEELEEDEIAYFRNIALINELDYWTYYALTAPEFPGTYYCLRKTQHADMLSSLLSGGVEPWDLWRSRTSIDDETFARINAMNNASWVKKVLDSAPSLDGFIQLDEMIDELIPEILFINNLPATDEVAEYGGWYEITAPEFPGLTYYEYNFAVINYGSGIYKRQL